MRKRIVDLITRRRHHERQYEVALIEAALGVTPDGKGFTHTITGALRCEECGAPWHGGQWKCTRCGSRTWVPGVGS